MNVKTKRVSEMTNPDDRIAELDAEIERLLPRLQGQADGSVRQTMVQSQVNDLTDRVFRWQEKTDEITRLQRDLTRARNFQKGVTLNAAPRLAAQRNAAIGAALTVAGSATAAVDTGLWLLGCPAVAAAVLLVWAIRQRKMTSWTRDQQEYDAAGRIEELEDQLGGVIDYCEQGELMQLSVEVSKLKDA